MSRSCVRRTIRRLRHIHAHERILFSPSSLDIKDEAGTELVHVYVIHDDAYPVGCILGVHHQDGTVQLLLLLKRDHGQQEGIEEHADVGLLRYLEGKTGAKKTSEQRGPRR